MTNQETACESLSEYIELFMKIYQKEVFPFGNGICIEQVPAISKVISFINWYKANNECWLEKYRLNEKEYDRVIHWISFGLDMPEKILKDINFDTVQFYNFPANQMNLFVAEIYVYQSIRNCNVSDRVLYMIDQYNIKKEK